LIGKGESAPRLWIVAGPNGCGKSTVYGRGDVAEFDGSVWIINPDLLTRRLQTSERLPLTEANLAAVQRIASWLDASIDVHQTIGVETVLSTPKYRKLVSRAKDRGFEVRLIYVYLTSLELQLERIRLRVEKVATTCQPKRWPRAASDPLSNSAGSFGKLIKPGFSTIPVPSRKLVALKEQMGVAELGAELDPELRERIMEPHRYSSGHGFTI